MCILLTYMNRRITVMDVLDHLHKYPKMYVCLLDYRVFLVIEYLNQPTLW